MRSVLLDRTKYKTKGSTEKKDLSTKLKLEFIFRYLVTGNSVSCLQYLYRVPK
jgi:hypothetical protein